MNSQKTDDRVLFFRVAERWKRTAADEVDTIGAWRGAVDESPERAEFRIESGIAHGIEWGTPNGFYSNTVWLRAWVLEHQLGIDVAALGDVYAAISAWHGDQNGSRVPKQPVLFAHLEAAMLLLNAAEIVVQRQENAAKLCEDKPPRKRRRRTVAAKEQPLTEKQLEAMQVVGECKGNIADAARRLGVDRKTTDQHYQAALKKLGRTAVKHTTEQVALDRRGQENLAADDDRRGI